MYLAITLVLIGHALALATDELTVVQVVFRHGDRTPYTATYPNDPYNGIIYGNLTAGQLTNAGKIRHYALGEWLRDRYDGFLSRKYYSKEIRIVSNEIDRCLQSAASDLAGLYPPEGNQAWNKDILWQPIPIHTNPLFFDSSSDTCPYLGNLLDTIQVNYKSINQQYKQLFEYVQEKSGQEIKDYRDLFSIRDVLYIESMLGLDLPEWTRSVYPNPLIELSDLCFAQTTATNEIARISNGPLYKELVDRFEDKSKKFQMYSGHDTNVANLMNVLTEGYEPFCPEFASAIIFELWENPNSKYVKMYLKRNDNLQKMYIKGCGADCEYETFKKILEPVSMSDVEKARICGFFINK